MLKKIISLILALCLTLAFSSCTTNEGNSDKNTPSENPIQNNNTTTTKNPAQPSNSGDNGNNNMSGTLTVSITPADGWKEGDSLSGSRIQYVYADTDKAYNTLINVDTEENIFGRTEREFAEKRIESQKLTLESWTPVFTDIADVSVGEYDALAYDVVTESGELQKMFFIFEGSYVYIIQCVTMTEFWELVQDDFTAMIDSFTLK